MKCVKGESGDVFRTTDRHAAALVLDGMFGYVTKAEWKTSGRKRSGYQDHAPSSVHPRKGSPPRHSGGRKKGKW